MLKTCAASLIFALALVGGLPASAAPPDETVSAGLADPDAPFRRAVRLELPGTPSSAWSLGGGLEMSAPIVPDTGAGLFGALAVQLDLPDVALVLRARYGKTSGRVDDIALSHVLVGVELAAYKLFDLPIADFALGFGVRGGLDYLTRRSTAPERASALDQFAGHLGPVARIEWAPARFLALNLDCGVDAWILDAPTVPGGAPRGSPLVPYCSLGFGMCVGQ